MVDLAWRSTYAVIDELGVDPLRDESFDTIKGINTFTTMTVDESTEFNLPRIADSVYGDANWWWIILVYNDIPDAFYVKRGMRLRLPNPSEVTTALSLLNLSQRELRSVEI